MLSMKLFYFIIAAALVCGYTALQNKNELSGKDLYRNCSGCHLDSGAGVKGFYPPHVGHVPELISNKHGRKYLIEVVLFGLNGKICVNNVAYDKGISMPAWGGILNDKQIAKVLNYISSDLGNNKQLLPKNFKPFSEEEVKTVHKNKLTEKQVYANRIKLFGEPCKSK